MIQERARRGIRLRMYKVFVYLLAIYGAAYAYHSMDTSTWKPSPFSIGCRCPYK